MSSVVHFNSEEKVWQNPSKEDLFSCDQSLGQLILSRLNELESDRIIEVNHDNGNKWTVSDIKRLCVTCAKNFMRLGTKLGDVVIFFCSLNSYTTLTVYGCYIIGAIVHPLDVNCTEDDLEFSLNIIDPKIILCDGDVYDKVQSVVKKARLKTLKHVLSFHSRDDKNTVLDEIMVPVDPADYYEFPKIYNPEDTLALLLSSSGSTGRPKVSKITHSVMIHAAQTWWSVNQSNIIYCASLFRWVSQVAIMLQSTLHGFRRIITSKPPSGELCAKILLEHNVTHTFGLPTLFLDVIEFAESHNCCLDSLQVLLTGGEAVPASLSSKVRKVMPNCKVIKCYGMTELASVICSNENVKNYDGNGGYLTPGISIKIIGENMKPLGYNNRGQIRLKSKYIFSGYWKGERTTEEAFDEDGWFITGDFGYMDDRNLLHITDRYKDIIVCDGKMIFPSAIEQILSQHPYVALAIIIGISHKVKGQIPIGLIKLKTDVIGFKNESEVKDEIWNYLINQIDTDQMPFGKIHIVEKFPLTYTGKIHRQELKIMLEKGGFNDL